MRARLPVRGMARVKSDGFRSRLQGMGVGFCLRWLYPLSLALLPQQTQGRGWTLGVWLRFGGLVDGGFDLGCAVYCACKEDGGTGKDV